MPSCTAIMEIKIRSIEHDGLYADLPRRASAGSAGVDLQALIPAPITIEPQKLYRIPTGIAMELPQGYVGLVYARSGLGVKHGVALSNGVGVIDSDYRGEILVGLCNLSDTPYTIAPMDRIAQLVIAPVPPVEYVWADSLSDTERGEGGFGSSGR